MGFDDHLVAGVAIALVVGVPLLVLAIRSVSNGGGGGRGFSDGDGFSDGGGDFFDSGGD
jgi:hypothetical protein